MPRSVLRIINNLTKGGVCCWFQRVPTNAVRICGPTKAALWLVESGLQIVAVVSDVAVSQRDA